MRTLLTVSAPEAGEILIYSRRKYVRSFQIPRPSQLGAFCVRKVIKTHNLS